MQAFEINSINATSGGTYLLIEAFQSIHGASGVIIDTAKVVLVMVIVMTSTLGALAQDSNGDGVPDVCTNFRRLLRSLRKKPRSNKRRPPAKRGDSDG